MKSTTKTKKTEISMSTKPSSVKKTVKVKVSAAVVPTSTTSVVNKIKKKKPRTEESRTKKLDKVKTKALAEENAALEIIATMKERSKKSNEDDHLAVYMEMFRQLRRIIKKTERGCLRSKTGQGAYQLATLYSQLRETIAEIRGLTDLSDHADNLIEKVVQPIFTTLTQNLSNSMYQVKLKTKDKLREKRVRRCFEDIDDITLEAATLMQNLYLEMCDNIKMVLLGPDR
jgi:hypothetical protein